MVPDVVDDATSAGAVAAVRRNLYSFFRHLARSPSMSFSATPAVEIWSSKVPAPWLNGAICSAAVEDPGRAVAEAVARFRQRNAGPSTWWFELPASASSWRGALRRHGYRHQKGPPGMTIPLDRLPGAQHVARGETTPPETSGDPPGGRVLAVDSPVLLSIWVQTFLRGYGLPKSWEPGFFDVIEGLGLQPPLRNYLGMLGDTPVATSSLFLAAGVAGLMFVSVVSEHRGRGMGRAMTIAPLLDAKAAGYRVGVLQASQAGYHLYRNIGFRKVCRVDHFEARPPST